MPRHRHADWPPYETNGSGLGKTRWVVERTFAWLHNFRRLRILLKHLAAIHEVFMKSRLHHLLATASKFIVLKLLSERETFLLGPAQIFHLIPLAVLRYSEFT
ncbi:hypothetical protein DF143_37495 [Burkholderia cenocepacia]|nr:hypothetical protein DF143_37495 [Burkholderia cenocepacia]RQV31764.1 hypothetical protein DF033_37015 [Burkholderia cenocepacia]